MLAQDQFVRDHIEAADTLVVRAVNHHPLGRYYTTAPNPKPNPNPTPWAATETVDLRPSPEP
jgi:hypothetical protein